MFENHSYKGPWAYICFSVKLPGWFFQNHCVEICLKNRHKLASIGSKANDVCILSTSMNICVTRNRTLQVQLLCSCHLYTHVHQTLNRIYNQTHKMSKNLKPLAELIYLTSHPILNLECHGVSDFSQILPFCFHRWYVRQGN